MKHVFGRTFATAAILVTAACGGQAAAGTPAGSPPTAAAPAEPAEPATVSVYSGVYTTAQAQRGEEVQNRECASCHSSADWSHGRLLGGWTNQPAFALVEHIRQTMPMDSPGRLSMQQYTDIFAYVLRLNNIPAGDTELQAEEDALQRVIIEYRR